MHSYFEKGIQTVSAIQAVDRIDELSAIISTFWIIILRNAGKAQFSFISAICMMRSLGRLQTK